MPSESLTTNNDTGRVLARRARIATVAMVGLIPLVVVGARSAIDSMRITPEKWVPETDPQRQAFESFRSEFEGNDIVYLSWEGCTIDDARLETLEADLAEANQLPDNPEVTPFERVITGYTGVREMQKSPLRLTQDDAVSRLQGFLVGPDGLSSCAVVVLTYDGNEHRTQSIEHLKHVAVVSTDIPVEELRCAGPPHDGVEIDKESVRGVNIYSTGATIVAAVLCWWCLGAWRVSAVVIGTACLGQAVVLSAIFLSGMTLDAILIVSPALIFVLTISAGIHFVNYFKQQDASLSVPVAVQHALKEGWRPCWIATFTTAAGLCSLAISRVSPIAAFGLVSAAGLLITVGLLMCVLPDAILRWPPTRSGHKIAGAQRPLRFLSGAVASNAELITCGFLACIVCGVIGLQNIRTSVDASGLFGKNTKIMQDYRWIESRIGPSVPVEVVVRFSDEAVKRTSAQLKIVRELQEEVAAVDGVAETMSAVDYLPTRLQEADESALAGYVLRRRLTQCLPLLEDLNYLHTTDETRGWRITGRVAATAGGNYGAIRDSIARQIRKAVASHNQAESNLGMSAVVTGMMPLIDDVQSSVLADLQWSLLTAFVLVGLVIVVVMKSPRLAIMATTLNALPVLIVFGIMGITDIPVDIGTMMTAAVAMGIAVDDTIHFLCSYRQQLNAHGNRFAAVADSIHVCGAAMLKTTFICSSAMLVFALSGFVPTRQFGLIMAAILLTAVVGDLVCLPALLQVRGFGRKDRAAVIGESIEAPMNNPSESPAH